MIKKENRNNNGILSKKGVQEILDRYNLRAKKSFGQNFLIDENTVRKIVDVALIDSETGVLEIGPGIGSLTRLLLEKSKKVLAYEIDERFIHVLENEFTNFDNLKMINQDFLKANINQDLEYFEDCKRVIVVANLPYYITTPIIFKLLETKSTIEEFYFMVQKEVGSRLTSRPNTKDYNSLSVLMEYKSEAKVLFGVSRNSFIPIPNVDSVIISVKKKQVDLGINNDEGFLKFVRAIFSQRRKTLYNNIISSYQFSKEDILVAINNLEKSPTVRSEELSLEEIANLYKILTSHNI